MQKPGPEGSAQHSEDELLPPPRLPLKSEVQLPLPVSHTAGETHRDPVAEAELLAEPQEKIILKQLSYIIESLIIIVPFSLFASPKKMQSVLKQIHNC